MKRAATNNSEIESERARLAALFSESDETRRAVLDGLIEEAARCRCELRYWAGRRDDLIKRGAPFTVTVRIDNLIVKLRASYTNINEKLCKWLTVEGNDEFDVGLADYE